MSRLQVCTKRGCPNLTAHARCALHDRTTGGWHNQSGPAPQRITGRKLQRLREQLFAQEPFCRACKVRVAAIRDHIIPLAEGGADTEDNVQPLCQQCSDQKTQQEAARGQRRVSAD